jgi:hypothetical protein
VVFVILRCAHLRASKDEVGNREWSSFEARQSWLAPQDGGSSRHCERSEVIHFLKRENWIASSQMLFAMTKKQTELISSADLSE